MPPAVVHLKDSKGTFPFHREVPVHRGRKVVVPQAGLFVSSTCTEVGHELHVFTAGQTSGFICRVEASPAKESWRGRPIITQEELAQMSCPFPPEPGWEAEWEQP
jgi:hypothetical protein